MYLSGAGTGMAAIPAVQRILQDRIPAVTGWDVAAVAATAPSSVSSRTWASTTPTSGTTITASASSALRGNPMVSRKILIRQVGTGA